MDLQEMNRRIIEEFRANDGKVGGVFEGAPMVLLKTIGAKSGQPRVNPLVYLPDGDRYLIVASYAGAPVNPPWYYNLLASGKAEVEIGRENFAVRAQELGEPERTQWYSKFEATFPQFTEYKAKTTRTIPVLELRRVARA
jgi:deazaflavin-dependent oxidoreductase (nitroreductase family)